MGDYLDLLQFRFSFSSSTSIIHLNVCFCTVANSYRTHPNYAQNINLSSCQSPYMTPLIATQIFDDNGCSKKWTLTHDMP